MHRLGSALVAVVAALPRSGRACEPDWTPVRASDRSDDGDEPSTPDRSMNTQANGDSSPSSNGSARLFQSRQSDASHDRARGGSDRHRRLPRTARVFLSAGGVVILVIAVWSSSIPDTLRTYRLRDPAGLTRSWRRPSTAYKGPPACDPFARPGFLSFDPTHAFDAAWVPFDPSCPPAPDYLGALRILRDVVKDEDADLREQLIKSPARKEAGPLAGSLGLGREVADAWGRPYPDLSFLQGKIGLMLGDSVDRNVLEHLRELLNARVRGFDYQNVTGPIPAGWDPRGTPWMLNLGLVGHVCCLQVRCAAYGTRAGRVRMGWCLGWRRLDGGHDASESGGWRVRRLGLWARQRFPVRHGPSRSP